MGKKPPAPPPPEQTPRTSPRKPKPVLSSLRTTKTTNRGRPRKKVSVPPTPPKAKAPKAAKTQNPPIDFRDRHRLEELLAQDLTRIRTDYALLQQSYNLELTIVMAQIEAQKQGGAVDELLLNRMDTIRSNLRRTLEAVGGFLDKLITRFELLVTTLAPEDSTNPNFAPFTLTVHGRPPVTVTPATAAATRAATESPEDDDDSSSED